MDVLCYMQGTFSFNTFSDFIMNDLSSIYDSSVIFIFDFVLDIVFNYSYGQLDFFTSSSTTPDLAQVVVGETRWLDGLELLKPHDMVIALGMLNGQIRVVTWRDLGDRLTG